MNHLPFHRCGAKWWKKIYDTRKYLFLLQPRRVLR